MTHSDIIMQVIADNDGNIFTKQYSKKKKVFYLIRECHNGNQ